MSIGTIALICGILGVVGGFIPIINNFTFVLCIAAIIIGFKAKRLPGEKRKAKIGFTLGITGIAITVIYFLLVAIMVSAV